MPSTFTPDSPLPFNGGFNSFADNMQAHETAQALMQPLFAALGFGALVFCALALAISLAYITTRF